MNKEQLEKGSKKLRDINDIQKIINYIDKDNYSIGAGMAVNGYCSLFLSLPDEAIEYLKPFLKEWAIKQLPIVQKEFDEL